MTKLVKKAAAAAPVSAGISYQRTAEGWGFHPLGTASKPSKRTGEVWVNFTVGKIRDPQMLALLARYLELKDEERKVQDAFGQRATELKLLTLPARASFFGLSRDPKSKFGLRPRDEGASIEDADDGMFI